MRERELRCVVEQAGGTERVGGAGALGELQTGERGGVTKRGAGTEHGDRPRQRPGPVGQPRELTLDHARDLLGPERPEPRGGVVVR